jgi:hypothetical protein
VYFTEFQAYVSAIEAAGPGTPIEGADTAEAPNSSFQTAFVANEAALSKPNIVELTSHYYPLAACGGTAPTIGELLGSTAHNDETSIADEAVAAAAPLSVPAVLDEGNSVVCHPEQPRWSAAQNGPSWLRAWGLGDFPLSVLDEPADGLVH